MGEQVESSGVLDRVSSLPDHILCRILSLLPIKDIVRTSIISLRWRHLYASSVSIIDFNDGLSCQPVLTENDNNFLNFVDRFLSNPKQLSLECFRVNDYWVRKHGIPRDESYLRLNGWICAALWCGVKEIDIEFGFLDVFTLPTLMFNCHSMVTLTLNEGDMKVPSNTCLPNLKTIHFGCCTFWDSCSVLRLISNCHVLENLEFICCDFFYISELNIRNLSLKWLVLDFAAMYVGSQSHRDFNVIGIDTPNLVYFKYVDATVEGYTLSDMKSLEKADIEITLLNSVDYERATNLLKGIFNVQCLCLTIEDCSKTFFLTPLEPVLEFNNLVDLVIRNFDNDDWEGTWIVEYLHCTPNLKTLTLELVMNVSRRVQVIAYNCAFVFVISHQGD
ncbi:F-box/FBD/LRR-repeat protein At1g78750-like isoform X2 [Hibiscus syriacus]|uniref:F-box/FBD/LRR-repeat protein At1g78750-like isoform X2 n=1 Tax=Hibiscus syriacus TaxID=106335 RepID=UPI0019210B57|nr:F-box/FBD/LRR-repeat protein At1g78750-like isoform X2 [Hibiscus syriacus]